MRKIRSLKRGERIRKIATRFGAPAFASPFMSGKLLGQIAAALVRSFGTVQNNRTSLNGLQDHDRQEMGL